MNIKKNFVYNGILLLSQYIFPLLVYPYISRIFGVERIGTLNWIESYINYFTLFSTLGLSVTGIREIAKFKNDKRALNKTFSELFVLHLLMTSIVIIIYVITILSISKFEEYKHLFFIGILKLLFNVFLIEWYYRGTENFKIITLRSIVIKLLYVILIFVFVRDKDDYFVYYFLTCSITVGSAWVNCFYARKSIKFSLKGINLLSHFRSFFTVGLYMLLTSMYTTFNVVYLGFVSSDDSVGAYTNALKLYTILLGLFSALNSVLIPRLSSLAAGNEVAKFKDLIDKSLTFVVTFCFPVICGGMALAPQIIKLISGSGFEGSIICFRIILPLILIVGIAQVFSNQILMSINKDRELAYTSLIGAIVGIFLNLILVPKYNEIGTSFVVLISEICVTLFLYFLCFKYVKLRLPFKVIALNFVLSIPYFLISYYITLLFETPIVSIILATTISFSYFIISQMFVIKNKLVIVQVERIVEVLINRITTLSLR